MKIVYIAHPISGDMENNLADIRRIVRKINIKNLDTVPFVPYYSDIVSMDDIDSFERNKGLANDEAILKSGIVNELWLTGSTISLGMKKEIKVAATMNIPIINLINKI